MAVVASKNADLDIDWLTGSEETARLLRRGVSNGGLRSTGAVTARADRIRTISADPAEVIPDADMVLMLVPAFAHGAILRRIAPYLSEATALGCMPARGGFEFEAARVGVGRAREHQTIFGLQTLPWSTRVNTVGELVHVGAVKQEASLAALPSSHAAPIARKLARFLGIRIIPTRSFLGMTLGNPGQFIHPGLMYGHFRSWSGEEYDEASIPMLYAAATDDMGELVERLSREAVAVADRIDQWTGGALNLGDAVLPAHDWLRRAYWHATSDTSKAGACFRTGPIQARKAPMVESRPGKFTPNFGYRYLSEDVPFGLVPTRALAEIADVETPAIDEVITWAQSMLQRTYLAGDSLRGADVRQLPIPQNYGVSTLSDLIAWESDGVFSEVSCHPGAPILA
jgi:NAD/NADP octopine/nopaline dehydrogenase, alpha-helical domain